MFGNETVGEIMCLHCKNTGQKGDESFVAEITQKWGILMT